LTTVPASGFPLALTRFVRLFNAAHYWDSHEELEGVWREGHSDFYQGLILYASAFVHVARGNAHGVRAQLGKASARLEAYRPAYLGVDVEALLLTAGVALEALEEGRTPVAPVLLLDRARVRGTEPELRPRAPGRAAG
jgi:predicted metal-dependent hydrolase